MPCHLRGTINIIQIFRHSAAERGHTCSSLFNTLAGSLIFFTLERAGQRQHLACHNHPCAGRVHIWLQDVRLLFPCPRLGGHARLPGEAKRRIHHCHLGLNSMSSF